MKKIILTELLVLISIAGLSVGLYYLVYGIDLRCDNYLDLLTFEARRAVIVLEIIGIIFLPILMAVSIARLVYYKFLKVYLTFEIIIASLLLVGPLLYKYIILGSANVDMAKEGWTIYPPLTGFSVLDEHDATKVKNEQYFLLGAIGLILVINIVVTIVSYRRRKSTGK